MQFARLLRNNHQIEVELFALIRKALDFLGYETLLWIRGFRRVSNWWVTYRKDSLR
jgi:hypothetical protein